MSIALMTLAWKTNLPSTQKMALLAMCDWANDEGGSLHPSISKVAERLSCSERQAKRVIHGLIDDGWLDVVGNENGGAPGQSRRYQLNVKRLETGDIHVTGDKLSRVTSKAETGDIRDTRRVTFATETGDTHVTQSVNRTINRTVIGTTNASDLLADVDAGLLEDWKKVRLAKRAGPITPTVVKGLIREAQKAGITLSEAIEVCCSNGWQGFRADWFGHARPAVVNKQIALEQRNKAAGEEWLRQQGIAA